MQSSGEGPKVVREVSPDPNEESAAGLEGADLLAELDRVFGAGTSTAVTNLLDKQQPGLFEVSDADMVGARLSESAVDDKSTAARAGPDDLSDGRLRTALVLIAVAVLRRANTAIRREVTDGGEAAWVTRLMQARRRAMQFTVNYLVIVGCALVCVVALAMLVVVVEIALQLSTNPHLIGTAASETISHLSRIPYKLISSRAVQGVTGALATVGLASHLLTRRRRRSADSGPST